MTYETGAGNGPARENAHSRMGVASFVIAILLYTPGSMGVSTRESRAILTTEKAVERAQLMLENCKELPWDGAGACLVPKFLPLPRIGPFLPASRSSLVIDCTII